MALFGKGDEADAQLLEYIKANAVLEAKLEVKDELLGTYKLQAEKLEEQVKQLQLALVWKEAPEAANERLEVQDRLRDSQEQPEEGKDFQEKLSKVNAQLLQSIEGDLFTDPVDMAKAIGGVKAGEMMDKLFQAESFEPPASIHGNEES